MSDIFSFAIGILGRVVSSLCSTYLVRLIDKVFRNKK